MGMFSSLNGIDQVKIDKWFDAWRGLAEKGEIELDAAHKGFCDQLEEYGAIRVKADSYAMLLQELRDIFENDLKLIKILDDPQVDLGDGVGCIVFPPYQESDNVGTARNNQDERGCVPNVAEGTEGSCCTSGSEERRKAECSSGNGRGRTFGAGDVRLVYVIYLSDVKKYVKVGSYRRLYPVDNPHDANPYHSVSDANRIKHEINNISEVRPKYILDGEPYKGRAEVHSVRLIWDVMGRSR